jgi:HK97 family phage portal protein
MYVLNGKFPFIHKISGETRSAKLQGLKRIWDDWVGGGVSSAGVTVTSETALKHSAYWRAINLLSSQIASFPIGLFKRLPNGDTQEITNHPAVRLLTRQPNRSMTPLLWREASQANVLIRGNAYSYINRDNGLAPISLLMLDSLNMNPKSDGDQLIYEYLGEVYDPYFILHIPGLSFDGITGKAVLDVAAESLGVGLAMQKYSANMFKNGAKQTGVLTHPLPLSPEARTGLRKSFDRNITGPEGGTMILDEGMKWMPTGIPPDQAQLLQSKQFSVQEMARWFGIPPHLLYEESRSTFNNIAEQGISFITYTLTQWVERWEAELAAKLLTGRERRPFFQIQYGFPDEG